jgi:outer membrane protein OmpA-like peptidoglycan-associated protein
LSIKRARSEMRNSFVFEREPFTYEAETSWEMNLANWAKEASEAVSQWNKWSNELELESSYNTATYVRWLQQALNQILGLRLKIDGANGPQTRSAIRSFQQRQGLTVDGIVGSKTDAALKRTLGAGGLAPVTTVLPPPKEMSCQVLDRFDFAKDQLKSFHHPQLTAIAGQVVASQMTARPVRGIQLIGHTDPVGDDASNIGLGQRRADRVKNNLSAAIEKIKLGTTRSLIITAFSKGESTPVAKDNARNRRVEVCLDIRPVKPTPPKPPVTPLCVPPSDITVLIGRIHTLLGSLPLGYIGVKLPTKVRCLTAVEQAFAKKTYLGSLDFTKILIADGLGAQGRPFTVAVPTSLGWHVVMLLGDVARDWSGSSTLIHELAHAWQSQHHSSDPVAYMKNSVECQVKAIADMPIAKAAVSTAAVSAAVAGGILDPWRLASIGTAAAGGEDVSAYAYIPGKAFGGYAAEQIAQQVEDSFAGLGRPTPAVLREIQSLSANVNSTANVASLKTISFHRKSTAGVVFH